MCKLSSIVLFRVCFPHNINFILKDKNLQDSLRLLQRWSLYAEAGYWIRIRPGVKTKTD